MRKIVFIGFIVLGALVGLLSSAKADWRTRFVMMGVGALFGAPIGGALAGIGKKTQQHFEFDEHSLPGSGTSSKDLAANFWRDEGHPPFAKPVESEDEMRRWDRRASGELPLL